jgi:L-fucose isomerase-like protein
MSQPFMLLPVASRLHDDAALRPILSGFELSLIGVGGEPITEADLGRPEPLALLVLTGGTEARILDLLDRRHALVADEPLTLIAHSEQNSLPAALEALARVRQRGGRGRIVCIDRPDDAEGLMRVSAAVDDSAAWNWMHRARIGLIGDPSDWLVASSPTPDAVREAWGPAVIRLPMDEVERRYRSAASIAGSASVEAMADRATLLVDVDRTAISDAARLYPALAAVARDLALDAVTVRCFDLLRDLHTSGCLAIARLTDDGVVAGCEGDLMSAVAMMWTRRLLGVGPWMANPARVDPAGGHVLLAHCTIAPSQVDGFALRTHFESGIGVGIAGIVPAGDVTLLRIGGERMEHLWIAEGSVRPHAPLEGVCRTQMDVELDEPDLAADLLERPLGNHLVSVPGRHSARLWSWWRWGVASTDVA